MTAAGLSRRNGWACLTILFKVGQMFRVTITSQCALLVECGLPWMPLCFIQSDCSVVSMVALSETLGGVVIIDLGSFFI